jgi:mitochondrial fission protein ELM1
LKSTTRVWAVASYRAGENSQIFGLAERLHDRLGWPYIVKRLQYTRLAGSIGIARCTTLAGITEASRKTLVAPWPDLVVSAGVKNEPVCRWIRRASGNRTRLVFLGRTWARSDAFDLTITTPQYRVRPAPNVIENLMTQHSVTEERLAAARDRWRERFAAHAAPRVGVLVGGDSGPFVFGANAARQLAEQATRLCNQLGGSALVTTSSRTRPDAVDVLAASLPKGSLLHRWRPDDPDNPYLGILALSDALIVTSDSIAMLSEAAAARRPLYIFDIGAVRPQDRTFKSRAYRAMMTALPARLSRDLGVFHDAFVRAGHAVRLGEAVGKPGPGCEAEAEATVRGVAELVSGKLGERVHEGPGP